MDEIMVRKQLRRQMSKTGWALLVYYAIMNLIVMITLFLDVIAHSLKGTALSEAELEAMLIGNGWGYILASAIGIVLILLWKKKEFFFIEMWKTERSMTAGSFVTLMILFVGTQGVFQLFAAFMEYLLNLFGLSVLDAIEVASGGADTISMFLYVGLVAPVVEEIIFRGLILRMLRPYGKGVAIVATAFLFGMFHGNLVQSPYAFLAGLILGYVAIEYSIGWAMVMHMCNNLILGDTFTRMMKLLPAYAGEMLFAFIIWGCLIASVIILICKRKKMAVYRAENRMHPWCIKSFFGSAGVIVFTVLMAISMLLTITAL